MKAKALNAPAKKIGIISNSAPADPLMQNFVQQTKDGLGVLEIRSGDKLNGQINLPPGSIQYGLINRVLHCLKPHELDAVFEKISSITKDGGKWYVMTPLPECRDYTNFASVYSTRKLLGIKYPGFCQNAEDYFSNPDALHAYKTMLLLTKEELSSLFINHGFIIEDCMELAIPTSKNPIWIKGNDMLAIIAKKVG